MRGRARRGLLLTIAMTLVGSTLATDVRVQVTNPQLLGLVQDALKALSTDGRSFTLVNAPDTVFALGGSGFSPDVASRSLATTPPRVEFNPDSPVPLSTAVQAELRRLLNLPGQQTGGISNAGTAGGGTSGAGTLAAGAATSGTSSSATSSPGDTASGTPTAAGSTAGTSSASASGTSTAASSTGATGTSTIGTSGASTSGTSAPGTSTGGTSKPPVKAGKADLNSDGVVDPADLAIFMANLGKSGTNLPGDLNGDGKVDNADLDAFIKLYKLP